MNQHFKPRMIKGKMIQQENNICIEQKNTLEQKTDTTKYRQVLLKDCWLKNHI